MIKLTIDINDTIRSYTDQLAVYYKKEINNDFDINNLVYSTNDVYGCFEFKNTNEKNEFLNELYPYELYGCNKAVENDLPSLFNIWLNNLQEYDGSNEIEISFVCPGEYNLQIQSTLYFLSKIGTRIRKIAFPTTSQQIWDKSDIVITANPVIMKTKPQDKILIKINTKYNESSESNFQYDKLSQFLENKETWMNLLKLEE